MSKCVEKSAKTVDEAVRLALIELGLHKDEVEVEVLEEGSKGLFGIGAKNAVVKVTQVVNLESRARDFLNEVFATMGLCVELDIKTEGKIMTIDLIGDNMGIIIQKLASAVKEMLYHVRNSSNPHNSTPTNTGSAPRSHNHSASNITSGTLSVTRGGTGQTSLSGLANALGSYFSIPVFGTYAGNGGTKRKIELPFTPSAVLVVDAVGMLSDDIKGTCGGLAVGSAGVVAYGASETYATSWNNSYTALMITDNGFFVNYSSSQKVRTNTSGASYRYIAWK